MAKRINKIVRLNGAKVEIISLSHIQRNSPKSKIISSASKLTSKSHKLSSKHQNNFMSVAERSYRRMVDVKYKINKAIEAGNDLSNIKDIKFVKPF